MMTPDFKESTTQTNVDWTIMLYIAADDVLANFAVESLRQLYESASASAPSRANVVVAAQFAYSTSAAEPHAKKPGEEIEGLYIFKKGEDQVKVEKEKAHSVPKLADLVEKPEANNTAETNNKAQANKTQGMVKMSQKNALTAFMKSVYDHKECKAKHYALILWGHGPELLLQPSAGSLTDSGDSMYITPKDLREALESLKRPKLDFIGFDACYMSMLEMAYELQDRAEYMIASQEEVPDASFPYHKLVKLFREDGKLGTDHTLDSLLVTGAEAYVCSYQDCICDTSTGMKPVTLSLLNLKALLDRKDRKDRVTLQRAVRSLADALLKVKDNSHLADLLIKARMKSKDYASGLYVDLYAFCSELEGLINGGTSEITDIKIACKGVLGALATSNFILKHLGDKTGHGISIYLPYLTMNQYDEVSKPLVKGGDRTHGGKGFGEALNGAATEYLMCARRSLILDTEKDYKSLKLAKDTLWYSFITDVWTNALIKRDPAELDFHYSAQQAWMNVTRPPGDPDRTGGSGLAETTSNEEAEGVLVK